MAKVAMQVDIAAPVAEVFEFVADYRNALRYLAHFDTFRPLTPHTYGLGAAVRACGKLHGLPISTDLEIVGFDKNRTLVSLSRAGIRSSSRWSFEPWGAGTRVTFAARYDLPHLPLARKVIDRLLEEEIKAGTRHTLERLKRVLEERKQSHRGQSYQQIL